MTPYIKSKKFHKPSHNRGLAILSMVFVLCIICLVFLYLIQTNSLVSCSYQIRQQKEHLKELEARNQELEIEIAQWQSPANLEEIVQSLGMVEVEQVIYLEAEKMMAKK